MKIRARKTKEAAAIIAAASANADPNNKSGTPKKSRKALAGERGGDRKKSSDDAHDMPLQRSTTVLQSDSIDAGAAEMTGK